MSSPTSTETIVVDRELALRLIIATEGAADALGVLNDRHEGEAINEVLEAGWALRTLLDPAHAKLADEDEYHSDPLEVEWKAAAAELEARILYEIGMDKELKIQAHKAEWRAQDIREKGRADA